MKEPKINFYSENDFELTNLESYQNWVESIIISEGKLPEEITYIFCDDDYLLEKNITYLNHDTLTDIITFDNSVGELLQADIFISTERVKDNANTYNVSFEEELRRVMAHGILHLCGFKDKAEDEIDLMRNKEEEKMKMFHVEQ